MKNIKLFFERLFMGNRRYRQLLGMEKVFEGVSKCFTIKREPEWAEAKSPSGVAIMRWLKCENISIDVNLIDVLANYGITINEPIKWNVTTEKKESE